MREASKKEKTKKRKKDLVERAAIREELVTVFDE